MWFQIEALILCDDECVEGSFVKEKKLYVFSSAANM
jgi:hypothetical protein